MDEYPCRLTEALLPLGLAIPDGLQIHDQADVGVRFARQLKKFPPIARFRAGHSCWRKVTDPALYARASGPYRVLGTN